MAKNVDSTTRFQGIADFPKESLIPDQFAFSRSIDYRSDPRQIKLLPKTVKTSGTVMEDLALWGQNIPFSDNLAYLYGDTGDIYRYDDGTYTLRHYVPNSQGNGLAYYGVDTSLYYTTNTHLGRYGSLFAPSTNPAIYNDTFLQTVNQVATNTFSLDLEAASSQYADRADTASLSITGDITLSAYIRMESLPSSGNTMTIISKWDESGATRSYIFDIHAISASTYELRLGLSNDGTATDFMVSGVIPPLAFTNNWMRVAVRYSTISLSATFMINGGAIATDTTAISSIHNNASRFAIGKNTNGAGVAANFFDGLIDDVRIYNISLSSAVFNRTYNNLELVGTEAGLVAYYKLNNAYTDLTANANDLTPSGGPVFSIQVPFGGGTRQDVDTQQSLSGNTYTIPTSISESATNRLTFTPTKNPLYGIDVNVVAKGTGTLTLTLHDSANNTIATAISLDTTHIGTGYVEFFFVEPWTVIIGNEYHFHLTSTVADTTIQTGTASDLETASYHSYFSFLFDVQWHPILPMLNFLAIGNGQCIATWDGATYDPNRITLPAIYSVTCLSYWREYLAIGVRIGNELADIDTQFGRIYFWDGISDTFNFFIDVPEGEVKALYGTKGELYAWVGSNCDMFIYVGGDKANRIKRLPKAVNGREVLMNAGSVIMYNSLVHFGVSSEDGNGLVEGGVYSWGASNEMYPASLSYDYPISTGTRTGNNLQIGTVMKIHDDLFIAWRDGDTYGVDKMDPTGDPYASGTCEFLIKDNDAIWRDQEAFILRGDMNALVSGESVDVKYKLDREASWHGLPAPEATVGAKTANLPISSGRNREYQLAVDLFASGSTSPTVLGVSLLEDRLEEEQQFPGGTGNTD